MFLVCLGLTMIIIIVFMKRKMLSIETILSAYRQALSVSLNLNYNNNNNNNSYIALYPVKIYKLAALYIKIR